MALNKAKMPSNARNAAMTPGSDAGRSGQCSCNTFEACRCCTVAAISLRAGTRTDRTYEPFYRFPKRPLLARSHALRNADWKSSLHGFPSHGVGSLPYCKAAIAPKERSKAVPASVSAIAMKLLAKTAEERYQTAASPRGGFSERR